MVERAENRKPLAVAVEEIEGDIYHNDILDSASVSSFPVSLFLNNPWLLHYTSPSPLMR